jgi:integrase
MPRLLQAFGERSAETITPLDIERWLSSQAEENKWKAATVNRFKALFSLAFRLGIENGKTSSNPAKLVHRRREDNGRIRWLSDCEEISLRTVIMRDYLEHLPEFNFALHTGLRKSEQYRLTWECVDFKGRLLTVPRTKNGDIRHIPLNSAAIEALLEVRGLTIRNGPVFVDSNGNPVHNNRHWFEKAVQSAKLENFTWHCLRHICEPVSHEGSRLANCSGANGT